MNILVNDEIYSFSGQTLADLIQEKQPEKPFAIAVNQQFVAKTRYVNYTLQPNDRIEIVRPVVGG